MLRGIVFQDTLRHNWRQILYWGGGLAVLGWFLLTMFKDADVLQGYADLIESMPPALMGAFGVSDASVLATLEGFIGFGYGTYSVLILVAFGVVGGMAISANEEDEGIMDIVLSLPLKRSVVIVEKYSAYAVLTAAITLLGFVGILLGKALNGSDFNTGVVFEMSVVGLPAALLVMAFTAFIATIIRRKSVAMGIATFFVIASFFVDFIAESVTNDLVDAIGKLSFFNYTDSTTILQEGLPVGGIVLMLAVAAILWAAALWGFQRRDIGL